VGAHLLSFSALPIHLPRWLQYTGPLTKALNVFRKNRISIGDFVHYQSQSKSCNAELIRYLLDQCEISCNFILAVTAWILL